jgi:type I restriction enzyme S subunit
MEVRAGYTDTDIGVFPDSWDMESFGKLFTFSNGVNADKDAYGKGHRFVNVLEPITFSHLYGPEIPGRVSLPSSVAAAYVVKQGDVLFNRTSETDADLGLAATYLGTEHVVFGGFVIRGRPTDERLDPIYSGYALRAPAIRSQIIRMGQGAIRANIGQQNLKRVIAPIPPKPEQHAIAAALSDVDALLGGLDRLIGKKRDLKQAAMQQLLTGQTRLPGFNGEWRAKSLSAICSMRSGEGITSSNIDQFSRYPCYGGNGLRGYTSQFTHDGTYALIGRQGALCGNVFGVEGQFFASEHAIVVTPSADTDIRWLTSVLGRMNLNQYSESSAQPGLSVSKILKLETTVPPSKAEQTAIVAVLTDMDAELSALQSRRNKTHDLKQAMMQVLLTGKTRLVPAGAAHA